MLISIDKHPVKRNLLDEPAEEITVLSTYERNQTFFEENDDYAPFDDRQQNYQDVEI